MIPTPEEMGMTTGGGIAGWIGGIGAAVFAAVLGLRRWLSGDAAARAEDSVSIEFLHTIMDQLKSAQERADRVEQERNEAIKQIGELKAQIAMLRLTVDHMQKQLSQMCGTQPHTPQVIEMKGVDEATVKTE